MNHFVRVIFDSRENFTEQLDESVFPTQSLLETADGRPVIEIPLPKALSEEESDEFADRLINYMIEQGHNDFDVEISMDEE